jgi:hypothetical protein
MKAIGMSGLLPGRLGGFGWRLDGCNKWNCQNFNFSR